MLFSFSDSGENVKLTIRNSVTIVSFHDEDTSYDVKISLTEIVFRELVVSQIRAITAYGSGELVIDGGIMKFRNLMNCFAPQSSGLNLEGMARNSCLIGSSLAPISLLCCGSLIFISLASSNAAVKKQFRPHALICLEPNKVNASIFISLAS
jgi:hypothetical protein